ncbi:MAG: FAD-dependent oxidoreductase [Gammaproteobacteria bacterium]|jgi:NADPH-dependent glutamate synthase beta subunit-like oxidoreductase/ferredoxin|nr:FAD-dependent oxidoreductase [Gammaproteobacteria bacterium]MBT6073567.1 FAD-dependent oxidoreductase [Gammaproteobacteria bacterium]MBT7753512.1 FAD-dependent oxidoreductase [Gammaproteobacteria bacterium]MDG2435095.1 FAD-dependent oxidoreductase [Gammaproteobacteria bacterium]
MQPTNTKDPQYFHKVVDCQWGCPAHTDVPAYIRHIAQGEFTEAYMINRESNVFPGILGRVCDRPCEPACRRVRVEEEPVAICRLKRVAGDLKGDIQQLLPNIPKKKNGKKIAIVGGGCASLTVANDLLPLGYEVDIFESLPVMGGLIRSNIPKFRLPPEVIDEEFNIIVEQGANLHLNHPIDSMKELLTESYDAFFIGTGAPKGRELDLPGRKDSNQIHIGISWLESVAFEHIDTVGKKVLIIGGGNTAMDCCRTSLRLGADNVKVMYRGTRDRMKSSDWELEPALEEDVDLMLNHSPDEYVVENGKLVGMRFSVLDWSKDEKGKLVSQKIDDVVIPCDTVILAIGQENSFPWVERDIGLEFDQWEVPVVDPVTYESTIKGVFFGGDAAFGPKNIIEAVEHGHQAAISIHKYCENEAMTDRLEYGMNLVTAKMGIHEWSYSNDYGYENRFEVPTVPMNERFKDINIEVELGFEPGQFQQEVERCLNCDIQTDFAANLCIECDACIDICPVNCLMITENDEEDNLRKKIKTPANNLEQDLFVSEDLPQTGRVMLKDEDVCIHCGLCAERCPTAAWDMKKFTLKVPYALDEANSNNKNETKKAV